MADKKKPSPANDGDSRDAANYTTRPVDTPEGAGRQAEQVFNGITPADDD